MKRYRALNGENGPVVVCEDDEPGTVMAMTGRQQDAEEIADALNHHQGAVRERDRLRNRVATLERAIHYMMLADNLQAVHDVGKRTQKRQGME